MPKFKFFKPKPAFLEYDMDKKTYHQIMLDPPDLACVLQLKRLLKSNIRKLKPASDEVRLLNAALTIANNYNDALVPFSKSQIQVLVRSKNLDCINPKLKEAFENFIDKTVTCSDQKLAENRAEDFAQVKTINELVKISADLIEAKMDPITHDQRLRKKKMVRAAVITAASVGVIAVTCVAVSLFSRKAKKITLLSNKKSELALPQPG